MEQRLDFRGCKRTAFSAGQRTEPDFSDCNPGQALHLQMETGRHPADFAVLPFAENEIVMTRTDGSD